MLFCYLYFYNHLRTENKINFPMRVVLVNLMTLFIIIKCVITQNWYTVLDYNNLIPANVYPIMMSPGMRLQVTLTWSGSADLDLYLYSSTDVLSQTNYVQASKTENNPQTLIFTYGNTQNSALNHYLRVDKVNGQYVYYSVSYVTYFQNGSIDRQQNKTNLMLYEETGVQFFYFQKTQDWSICQGRVTYTGPSADIKLYSPKQQVNQTPFWNHAFDEISSHFVSVDLPYKGRWIVAVHHGIQSFINPSNVGVKIEVNAQSLLKQCQKYNQIPICEDGLQYNQERKRCQLKSIYYTFVISAIFACIYVCLCLFGIQRYLSSRQQQQIINNNRQRIMEESKFFQQSLQKMDLKQKQQQKLSSCSICLDQSDLLAILQCGHTFHENCIKTWLRKNNICPLCRVCIVQVSK